MKSKVAGTQAGTQPRGLCPLVRRRGAGGGLSLGPSGSGCRGPGAGGLPALHSSWPRLDGPQAGLQGTEGRVLGPHAFAECCARIFVGFFFCFLFLKKKKNWFPRARFVGLAVPPGGGEARRSALRRPGGVSLEKGSLCGGRAGGQGTGHCFPLLVYSARTDGSFCRLREGWGLHGNPRVYTSLCPSIPQQIECFALWPCLSRSAPQTARTGQGCW